MKIGIITDSACDLTPEMERGFSRQSIPFKITLGEKTFVDDGSIEQGELIREMKAYQGVPKTAAPSPGDFLASYEKADQSFVVTISSALSATYSNAILAKQMLEEKTDKLVHVFDSKSAGSGETLVYLKIKELLEQNMGFEEIVTKVEEMIRGMRTIFVLESVENLRKNGRLSKVAGFLASVLSIKPVLYADEKGEIKLKEKARGLKKAHELLIQYIGEDKELLKERIMVICHCNRLATAQKIRDEIEKRFAPKEIHLVDTGGLTTIYADDGGIIISY
ncbi:MAG: DegV family protein [Tissierellia bacterium]|nr:DegV family protein [Tissierellia bacterium]